MLLSLLLIISCLAASCGGAGIAGADSGISVVADSQVQAGFKVELSEYTIIRPEKASDNCVSAAAELKRRLDILTEGDMKIIDDWVRDADNLPGDALEILLGGTNRRESEQAGKSIEGMRFSISISGSRIVINAASDTLLETAVGYFITSFVKPTYGEGCFYLPMDLYYVSGEYSSIEIVRSGAALYNIVYPGGANAGLKAEYTALGDAVKRLSGSTSVIVGTDTLSKSSSYDTESCEILLGDTGYPETAEAMKMLKADEYAIIYIGNKIVVCGRTRESGVYAVKKFISLISASAVVGEDGKVSIKLIYGGPLIYKSEGYSAEIPDFTAGVLEGAFDCGEDVLGMYYSGVSKSEFDKYCAAAAAAGFSMLNSHSAAHNTFKTFSDGNTRFYITYSESDTVKIITEDASATEAPITAETYSSICTPTVTQLALSYTPENTNGMGYIIRLSDGSFIIYDGGFTADSDTLMKALNRLNVTGEMPHIRMWLLTHMHGDHYQAFLRFSVNYSKDVKLDYLALNVAHRYYDVDYSNVYSNGKIASALSTFTGARQLKLHAGSVLRFADAEIEILCTQEELYPGILSLEFSNDTSVVSRLKLGGQTVLFPGDAQTMESGVLAYMYGAYLKSDFIQISHHGSVKYSATRELYELIAPEWAFFPGSMTRYAENSSSDVNKYLIRESGIKQIFIADKSDRTITLPFGK